jgi:hypothetical protein
MCKVSFSLVGLAHLSIVRAVKLSNCKKKYYFMHLLHKLLLLTILKNVTNGKSKPKSTLLK